MASLSVTAALRCPWSNARKLSASHLPGLHVIMCGTSCSVMTGAGSSLLVAFKQFSILDTFSLHQMHLGVDFFELLLIDDHHASWICGLISFIGS